MVGATWLITWKNLTLVGVFIWFSWTFFLTHDEWWFHHFEPIHTLKAPPLQKGNGHFTCSKVLLTIFKRGPTINGEYYINYAKPVTKSYYTKLPEKLMKRVLFQHDDAPAYKSFISMAADLTIISSSTWKNPWLVDQ